MEGVAGSLRLNAPSLTLENEKACAPSGRASSAMVIEPPAATVPVPERFALAVGVAGSLEVTSSRAVFAPLDVGLKTTSIVHVAFGASTAASQLFVSMPKCEGLVPPSVTPVI